MSWWPFSKAKREAQTASSAEFRKQIEVSKARTDELEDVVARLKQNREKIHQRALDLIGEENVVAARKALKSTPG